MHRFARPLLVLGLLLAVPAAQAAYDIKLVGSGGSVILPPSPFTATSTVTLNGPSEFSAVASGGNMFMFTNTSTNGTDAGNIFQTSGPLNASNISAVYLEAVGFIDLQSTLTGSNTLQLWANYGGSSTGATYSANTNCGPCAILLWNNIGANAVDLRSGDSTHTGGIINQLGGAITTSRLTGYVGGDVTLNGANQIQSLGGFTTLGGFSLTNAAALTQSAALVVTGTSNFQAGSNSITLANVGNSFGGAVSASGSSVSIANSGTLTLGTISSAGALALQANVSNPGTLSFGNGSTAGSVSGTYTQSGTLSLHASATGSDRLAVSGNASLGGTLAVSFTAPPATGSTFTVLTASAITGAFATTNVSGLSANQSALVSYSNGNVTLRIAASYPVTATANGHGTITPASQQALSGNTASFTVSPDTGFEVLRVTGDTCAPTQQGTSRTWNTGPISATCAVTATFADFPSQCTGTQNFAPAFFDDFAGTSLDPSRWTAHAHGGTITLANNSVALSGSTFPYVASTGSPIPATGPFSVRWIATYTTQGNDGTGSMALATSLPNDGASNWSDVADAWEDGTGYRVQVQTDATTVARPYTQAPPTVMQHDVEYCWLPTSTEVWVDGQLKLQQAPRNAGVPRPAMLWFGAPNGAIPGPWSPFTLYYVEVRALNDRIFANGFETP